MIMPVGKIEFAGRAPGQGGFLVVVQVDAELARRLRDAAVKLQQAATAQRPVQHGQNAPITVKVKLHVKRFHGVFRDFRNGVVAFALANPGHVHLKQGKPVKVIKRRGVAGP